MIDYERLKSDLDLWAVYILDSIKKEYGCFFNEKSLALLDELIRSKDVVVIAPLGVKDKVHIPPTNEHFKKKSYNAIHDYFRDHVLPVDLFKLFINLNISEEEHRRTYQANSYQKHAIYLRTGFANYIARDFCNKHRLAAPKAYNEDSLEFVDYIRPLFPTESSLYTMIFAKDYFHFSESFFEMSGANVDDLYSKYKYDKLAAIVKKYLKGTLIREEGIQTVLDGYATMDIEDAIRDFYERIYSILYKQPKKREEVVQELMALDAGLIKQLSMEESTDRVL